MSELTGRCLCGAVEFSFKTDHIDHPSACHCGQCRRWSGHVWASLNIPQSDLVFRRGEDKVKWFASSEVAQRGFCSDCGASLFWIGHGFETSKDKIALALGALDAPTGLKLEEHIYVSDKGDYYEIADGTPQRAR